MVLSAQKLAAVAGIYSSKEHRLQDHPWLHSMSDM
jgi:hypothetical protein